MTTKEEDYTKLKSGYARHSADIRKLQNEVDRLQVKHDLLKNQLTPRGDPTTDRSNKDERRPEMYLGRTLEDRQDEPEKTETEPIRDLHIYHGFGERDKMYTDRSTEIDRRPGMYVYDLNNADRRRDQASPRDKVPERRPEMYYYKEKEDIQPKYPEISRDREPFEERRPEMYRYKLPRKDESKRPTPGGLVLLRFRNPGNRSFNVVKEALQRLESIMRNTGGFMMGMATRDNITVYATAAHREPSWDINRNKDSPDYLKTTYSMAALWFATLDGAESVFDCKNPLNRFKEHDFPEFEYHECLFLPLVVAPSAKPSPVFLIIEIQNAREHERRDSTVFTQFESELREELSKIAPSCQPIVSSTLNGRKYIRTGNMVRADSKVLVGRFDSRRHVEDVWDTGLIQYLAEKYGFPGQMNVVSFIISEVH